MKLHWWLLASLTISVATAEERHDSIPIRQAERLPADPIPCQRIPLGEPDDYKPCIARLPSGELLLTFTVRDLTPPLGVRALFGTETEDGFEFDFTRDRIMLDTRSPVGKYQGGGFGPTVQLDDGTLVTSYSYRGEDDKTQLELVRWQPPRPQPGNQK